MVYKWAKTAQCILCGCAGSDIGLCQECVADLPFQGRACRHCAMPLSSGEICGRCLVAPPVYDEAVSIFDYNAPVDSLIQRLKFRGDLAYARTLGTLMADSIVRRSLHVPQVIIPVPLHRSRLAARGFNQALELARPIARRLGLALVRTNCIRTRATAEQSTLGALERRRNVRNAFSVVARMDGADVAVIDDVMTTGHTIEEVAGALKLAGVDRVAVWVCARAMLIKR